MKEGNKEILKQLCIEEDLPLFYQPAWLDVVCTSGTWDVAIAKNKTGAITAIMTYHYRMKYGVSALLMPRLTPYGGILFFPPNNMLKEEKLNSFRKKYSKQIIDQLPKATYFNIAFHPSFKDWQPFMWENYRQKTRYTYRLSSDLSIEEIWQGFDSKVRNHISNAEKVLRIEKSEIFDEFYKLNVRSFEKQGIKISYDQKFLEDIHNQVNKNIPGSVSLHIAKEGDQIMGGAFLVSDNATVYLIATGLQKNAPRGTMNLLIWNAIKEGNKQGKTFDFEGSNLPQVEPFFRSFGGKQTPCFQIFGSKQKLLDAVFVALGKL